jgi:hypothetical protein
LISLLGYTHFHAKCDFNITSIADIKHKTSTSELLYQLLLYDQHTRLTKQQFITESSNFYFSVTPAILTSDFNSAPDSYKTYTTLGPCHSFPPRRPGFEPGSDHVGFVVDKVALGQVFTKYFGFPCQFEFHRLLHNRRLSSGAGTMGRTVAAAPNGLRLTP